MEDDRNHLFKEYARLLDDLQPDAFLFENVPGLRNMNSGRVMAVVLETLEAVGYVTNVWVLNTDDHAVPQRRTRVIIVGTRGIEWKRPRAITTAAQSADAFSLVPQCPSVKEALDDLPALEPGQDGANLGYKSPPTTDYQCFVRSKMTLDDYLASV
jgi:DNA (cytosine-5)-methyltransferase 1